MTGFVFATAPNTRPARSQIEFIANSPLPLEIKSIEVRPDGSLSCAGPNNLAFRFAYFGIQFHGAIDRDNTPTRLALSADLGPFPFSFDRPALRPNIRAVIAAANRLDGARFEVSSSQHMVLAGEIDVDQPVTASALLIAATQFVLAEKPVLDLLACVLRKGERTHPSRDAA